MRGLVLILLLAALMVSFSLIIKNLNEQKIVDDIPKISKFSTFTSAVCQNESGIVHCKDEIFVNCNGEISKANDVAECNGTKLEIPKATGFAVFGKEWKDPRGE